jgi:hypothetical protein
MSSVETWFWILLLVLALPAIAAGGALLVRSAVGPDVLACHNNVAGFIYGVIGVVYAVLLGFTAIVVWEQFRNAQEGVEREADALADLHRDAQNFPPEVREQVALRVRAYARAVIEKEWPAMAEGQSSPETWAEYEQLWRTYDEFTPHEDHQRAWYAESIRQLNALGDERRDRLLRVRSHLPTVIWSVLLAGGVVTIGFTFFFGTQNSRAQGLMTAALAFTIGVVLLSILALEQPFAGITRVHPEAFRQVEKILGARYGLLPDAGAASSSAGRHRSARRRAARVPASVGSAGSSAIESLLAASARRSARQAPERRT